VEKVVEKGEMSILVDLYNLHLTRNLKNDENKITQFLEKYYPRFLRFRTAEDIKQAMVFDKEKQMYTFDVDMMESLGGYEYNTKRSWFEGTQGVRYFYDLYDLARKVVTEYLNSKVVSQVNMILTDNLLSNVKLKLILEDKEGSRHGSASYRDLPRKEYKFLELPGSGTIMTLNSQGGFQIHLTQIKYSLFKDILNLWNGKYKLKLCAFHGNARSEICHNVLISTRGKKYCSKKHYDMARRFRRFKKTGS